MLNPSDDAQGLVAQSVKVDWIGRSRFRGLGRSMGWGILDSHFRVFRKWGRVVRKSVDVAGKVPLSYYHQSEERRE